MRNPRAGAALLAWLLFLFCAAPAAARPPAASDEAGIRATVTRWYEELGKKEKGRIWGLTAPGFIDASPHYRHVDTGSRALGPRIHTTLAAKALRFSWEIDSIRRDSSFAKVQVWERGYFYAWAAQQTYERAAATTFILERQEKDGSWLILAMRAVRGESPPTR